MRGIESIRAQRAVRNSRRGSATVIVLMVVFTLMIMGVAFFQVGSNSKKKVFSSFDDERALSLAESGLSEALIALRAGATGNVGTIGLPAYLAGGVFWSEATPADNGTSRVKVTAMIGSGRRSIEAIVDSSPLENPLFETVLNSDDPMVLNQGVVIDSFDSSLGDYTSQQTNVGNGFPYAGDKGDVRSNKDIYLNNSSTVFGDATPGVGYTVDDAATGSFVSGSKAPAVTNFTFSAITYPPGTTSAGDYSANGLGNTLTAGTYEFDAFTVGNAAELTIQGPAEIIVQDFTGSKDGMIHVDATNGPVTFYVRDSYTHNKGFEVDAVSGSTSAIAFMVEGINDITFPSATNIRGAYYTPNANILFSNGNECWGAFASKQIVMSNDMLFHFDEDLLNHWKKDDNAGQEPRAILAWSEVGVDQELLSDRRDPMLVLNVVRQNLPSPAQAWDPPGAGGTAQ